MNNLLYLDQVGLKIAHLDKAILRNVSYQVKEGDFVVIVGSNGSGKSSLLKILDKRYQRTEGSVYLAERDLHKYAHKDFCRRVITLTQDTNDSLFASLSVLENCLLAKQRHANNLFGLSLCKERDFFQEYLSDFNPSLADKLDIRVNNLSGGQRQALALALSILYPPQLLLLDEHTSALDPKAADRLMRLTKHMIKKHNITCLLTTHDLDIALNYGNRIMALKNGEILRCIEKDSVEKIDKKFLLASCY